MMWAGGGRWRRGSCSAVVDDHLPLVGPPLQGDPPHAAALWCFESGAAGPDSDVRGVFAIVVGRSVIAAISGARAFTDAAAKVGPGVRSPGGGGGDAGADQVHRCDQQYEGNPKSGSIPHRFLWLTDYNNLFSSVQSFTRSFSE